MMTMQSHPRPLSDHTPIIWQVHEGQGRSTFFNMDKSWSRPDDFKHEGAEMVLLTAKATVGNSMADKQT